MITEKALRDDHPALIRALTGLPAKVFWELVATVEARLPAYEHQRYEQPDRQRGVGAGHPFDQPVVIRVAMVLMYLRLHIDELRESPIQDINQHG